MVSNCSNGRKKPNKHQLSGFALPTILIASIIMLSVLLVSVASTVAMRVSLSAQTYNQLAQTAGDAGLAYAKACLDASGGVPMWTDANPLTPSTDCSGNQLAGFTCPDGTADSRCAVSINGGAMAQVLVVGGGGGGGSFAGGGGAGGAIYTSSFVVTPQAYPVTVAGGGAGTTAGSDSGVASASGDNSVFSTITAVGGGGGGTRSSSGRNGGSGGGASPNDSVSQLGGLASPAGQGYNGGSEITPGWGGSGGGGAGGAGAGGNGLNGGNGGVGIANPIAGSTTGQNVSGTYYLAGGGGGGTYSGGAGTIGNGGNGGGGAGTRASNNGVVGTANTGGGGGGSDYQYIGGAGGSGVVIISYPNGSLTASGCDSSVVGAANTVCTFTTSGTFTVTATTANSSPVVSTFSVGLPTVINGAANEINSVGSSKLLKSSDNTVWRRYTQSSRLTIPAVVIIDPIIFGSGADGAITVAAGKNINTDTIATGRTCADAVNYSVTALTTNTATLSTTPAAGCLVAGDEMLLINLQGINANFSNTGNYETVRIQSISTNTVVFAANKTKYYGNGASDDTNIGTVATNQRAMLQRIPNYTNVTINSGITLTANAWDGTKSGVLFFRANGTLANSGIITMSGLGYRGGTQGGTANLGGQGGESFCGVGGNGVGTGTGGAGASGGGSGYPAVATGGAGYCGGGGGAYPGGTQGVGSVNSGGAGGGSGTHGGGAGAGYGSIGYGAYNGGTNSSGNASMVGGGGGTYGVQDLTKLYLGSGGGKGGDANSGTAANGGNGGGIVVIMANITTITGTLSNSGANGVAKVSCVASEYSGAGGGGSGGSILIRGNTVSVGGNTVALAGAGGNASCTNAVLGVNYNGYSGGAGRIAIYYTTLTGTTNPAAYSP